MEPIIIKVKPGLYRFPALANDRRLRGMKTLCQLAGWRGLTEAILVSGNIKTRIKFETGWGV